MKTIILREQSVPLADAKHATVYAEKNGESYRFTIYAKTKKVANMMKRDLKIRLHAENYKNVSG